MSRTDGALRQSDQGGRDRLDHWPPIVARPLAEEPRRRIPGAVLALEEPAPIRNEGQEDEDALAHRAGEMGDRRVDGNHEIEIGDGARSLCKVGEFRRRLGDGCSKLHAPRHRPEG